jgi:hypothetical protein
MIGKATGGPEVLHWMHAQARRAGAPSVLVGGLQAFATEHMLFTEALPLEVWCPSPPTCCR